MIFEILGKEAVAAVDELLMLEGIQGSYQIPEDDEKEGALTIVATIVAITVGALTVAEKLYQWAQKYLKAGSSSPRLEKVLIIDDKGNRLLLKDATIDEIQVLLKGIESK